MVELRKRTSDAVVGQITHYMADVTTELAREEKIVKGIIVALEDDQGFVILLSSFQVLIFVVMK